MKDYDELLKYLCHWYNVKPHELAWHGALPAKLHPDVTAFYRMFGQLSLKDGPFAVPKLPDPLAAQDTITPVDALHTDQNGYTNLITENQSVWHAGQVDSADTIFGTFDPKIDDYGPVLNAAVHDLGGTIKDTLITSALTETVMSAADAGPVWDYASWTAAEQAILQRGKSQMRPYVFGTEPVYKLGWTDDLLGFHYEDAASFMILARRGDRAKGQRPRP